MMKEKKTDTKNFWVQQLHIIKKLHGKYNNNNEEEMKYATATAGRCGPNFEPF